MTAPQKTSWTEVLAAAGDPSAVFGLVRPEQFSADDRWLAEIVAAIDDQCGDALRWSGMLVSMANVGHVVRLAPGGREADGAALRCLLSALDDKRGAGTGRELLSGARGGVVSAQLTGEELRAWRARCGAEDALCLSACPEPGTGVVLWASLPSGAAPTAEGVVWLDQAAVALLDALSARLETLDAPPSSRARASRRPPRAVTEPTAVREAIVRKFPDPEEMPELGRAAAEAFWGELLDGVWYLADHYDSGGRHQFVWHRSDPRQARSRAMTERERDVLRRVAAGDADRSIALELGCSPSTVSTHRLRAMAKLGIGSRTVLAQVLAAVAEVGN